MITPDSDRAEPLAIQLEVGPFKRRMNASSSKYSWDWGVVAKIAATTFYLLTDPEHVEHTYGSVVGKFEQELAISMPVPRYSNLLAADDSIESNRTNYTIADDVGGRVVIDIDVTQSKV